MARALGTSFTASMAVTMAPKSTLAVTYSVEEASVLAASEAVLLAASEEALAEEEAPLPQPASRVANKTAAAKAEINFFII